MRPGQAIKWIEWILRYISWNHKIFGKGVGLQEKNIPSKIDIKLKQEYIWGPTSFSWSKRTLERYLFGSTQIGDLYAVQTTIVRWWTHEQMPCSRWPFWNLPTSKRLVKTAKPASFRWSLVNASLSKCIATPKATAEATPSWISFLHSFLDLWVSFDRLNNENWVDLFLTQKPQIGHQRKIYIYIKWNDSSATC